MNNLPKALKMGGTNFQLGNTGVISHLWINKYDDREKEVRRKKPELPAEVTAVRFYEDGIMSDKHRGWTTGSLKRQAHTEAKIPIQEQLLRKLHGGKLGSVFNARTWSAVSLEEMAVISGRMDLELGPGWFKENITIKGLPNLSLIPVGSLLVCWQPDHEEKVSLDSVLRVQYQNSPCIVIQNMIANQTGEYEKSKTFINFAQGYRGVVGSVVSEGMMHVGSNISIYEPQAIERK